MIGCCVCGGFEGRDSAEISVQENSEDYMSSRV
jgi:hypothetical protein